LEGRCFNCFATNHIARFCRSLHRCWKCYRSGHRANDCKTKTSIHHHITGANQQHKKATLRHITSTPPPGRDTRSYVEVVSGAALMAARYPGIRELGRPAATVR
jgi:hypothetical protein